MNSLSLLTAAIVHEVNQPLSGIAINASTCLRMLYADPPNIEVARETAQRTLRDVNRAAEVIKRLRGLFMERARATEAVDVNEVVQQALATSRSELTKGRISVRQTLAHGLPLFMGDRIQLEQVILNIVRNAIEAMLGDPMRLRELTIVTQQHGESVVVSVQDTGAGIAQSEFDDVFKPFYSTKPDGMGIGLCVSRAIVESHGGRLWATANDGPGATFWLAIPCTHRVHDSRYVASCKRKMAMSDVAVLAIG